MKLLLLTLLLTTASFAQVEYGLDEAEFGTLSELKGKTKVFLAVNDLNAREIIVKALAKDAPALEIISQRKDAEFGIAFTIGNVDVGSNVLLGTAHNVVTVGEMLVYTYLPLELNATKGRIRVLWRTRKTQDWSGGMTLSRHPAANAIKDFLKAYKKLK